MVELIPRRFPNLCQINKKNVLYSFLPTPTPRGKRFKFIVLIVIAKEGRLPSENHKDFHMPVCGKHSSTVGKARVTLLCENEILKKIKINRQTKWKVEGEVEYKI